VATGNFSPHLHTTLPFSAVVIQQPDLDFLTKRFLQLQVFPNPQPTRFLQLIRIWTARMCFFCVEKKLVSPFPNELSFLTQLLRVSGSSLEFWLSSSKFVLPLHEVLFRLTRNTNKEVDKWTSCEYPRPFSDRDVLMVRLMWELFLHRLP